MLMPLDDTKSHQLTQFQHQGTRRGRKEQKLQLINSFAEVHALVLYSYAEIEREKVTKGRFRRKRGKNPDLAYILASRVLTMEILHIRLSLVDGVFFLFYFF